VTQQKIVYFIPNAVFTPLMNILTWEWWACVQVRNTTKVLFRVASLLVFPLSRTGV